MSMANKRFLVVDLGLFTENAVRLARDAAEVFYYTIHEDPFPEPFQAKIGEGLEGIERVWHWGQYIDKVDGIFIPDTMFADFTEWLKSHDYPVAGAGASEKLELDRYFGRKVQGKNGLPVQDTNKVKGVTALRKFTEENSDYYVKIDAFRGLEETFCYKDVKDAEQTIDTIASKLGPYKEETVFILEEKLDGGVEPGIDFITFDDELVYPTMIGYESKSVGIIERVYKDESELPDAAQWAYEGFAPEFKKNKTRFFASLEFLIGKDKLPYVIDPTVRLAAPGVAAIQTELFENYSEVVYGLCRGEMVKPIIKHKYAVAAAMESSAAEKNWVNISFPKEMRQWVKFRMAVKHKNDYYAVPGMDSLGTIIAFGNTIDEALKTVKERSEQVEGKRLSVSILDLEKVVDKIEEGRKYGIDF